MTTKRTRRRVEGSGANDLVSQIEEGAVEKEVKPRNIIKTEDLIPSGSTLLNCACSSNPMGAYGKGKIVTLPGGSASGKTMLTTTMFAEINTLKRFDPYMFILDDTEEAFEIDVGYMFNRKLERRIQPPAKWSDGLPKYSVTIQDFKTNILKLCKKGDPFIYVLDSLDALSSDEEMEKEYKKALAATTNPEAIKELKGSYHTEKAKIIGHVLRICNGEIKKTDSLLVIIQQERDKIGVVFGSKKTTSGGRAPFFYSTHQVWLSKTGNITDKGLKIGSKVKAEVKKNKLTGKMRDVEFNIYPDYGLDDITSCVEFLCENKHWKQKDKKWIAKGIDIVGNNKPHLIRQIEDEGLEYEVKKLVGEVWNDREESVRLNRKPRY